MKKNTVKVGTPESHFSCELRKFEQILNNLPREKAFELMVYSANYWKLKHVKNILPPSVSVKIAADVLCDDIESLLRRRVYMTTTKKVDSWMKLVEIVSKTISN